jgi:hypothetical protein
MEKGGGEEWIFYARKKTTKKCTSLVEKTLIVAVEKSTEVHRTKSPMYDEGEKYIMRYIEMYSARHACFFKQEPT